MQTNLPLLTLLLVVASGCATAGSGESGNAAAAPTTVEPAAARQTLDDRFPRGSELYVLRHVGTITYHHAGVYVGDGKVVHVSAEPLGAVRSLLEGGSIVHVVETSYATFVGHGDVTFGPSTPGFEPDDVVERALMSVGKPWDYDPEDNNCQHFTSEVVSGTASSPDGKAIGQAMNYVANSIRNEADSVTKQIRGIFE